MNLAEIRPGGPISGPEALLHNIEHSCRVFDFQLVSTDGFRGTGVTKPYEFIGFGAMAVTKPYKFMFFVALEWSDVGRPFLGGLGSRAPRKWTAGTELQSGPGILHRGPRP